MTERRAPAPVDFFARLRWLDGTPLLDTIEPYRRELLSTALYTFRPDGSLRYNMVLSGRAKKNWKSTDLVLAAFYRLLFGQSPQGNDALIVANDEGQAGDDLDLAKKLVRANPVLARELVTVQKQIRRRDGRGSISVLPGRDVEGAHGKTAIFIGFDEIHGYRDYDLFEALAPDPTRDTLQWLTSYDTIYNVPGVPLVDMKARGIAGDDDRMLFSWYSGDLCTDPDFADLEPELRANPSMASWPEGRAYLDQQRRRLPTHKYRRLHLNLPGAPEGAFFDGDMIMKAISGGVRVRRPVSGRKYAAFVDMSGGSSDEAVLAIAHRDENTWRRVLDLVATQDGTAPFDPRAAVRKFAGILQDYGVKAVTGDRYAGETFRVDFRAAGIAYEVSERTKSEIYEATEPAINAREVDLLDHPRLHEQLLTLVVRGSRIDHPAGGHDDIANAACGALALCGEAAEQGVTIEVLRVDGSGFRRVMRIGADDADKRQDRAAAVPEKIPALMPNNLPSDGLAPVEPIEADGPDDAGERTDAEEQLAAIEAQAAAEKAMEEEAAAVRHRFGMLRKGDVKLPPAGTVWRATVEAQAARRAEYNRRKAAYLEAQRDQEARIRRDCGRTKRGFM